MRLAKRCLGTIAYLGGLPAVLEPFCWAWGQLIQYNTEYLCDPGSYVHYDRATVSYHAFARNSIVERMLGEWLLMLDTDHAPDPDLAMRLLFQANRCEVDVLSAVYCHKTPPHSPVLYQWDSTGEKLQPVGDWGTDASVIQIGSAGGGSLFVRRAIFDRIRDELHEGPFEPLPPLGEDHSFFKRLLRLKIPAYAAMFVESPHLSVRPHVLAEYDRAGFKLSDRIEVGGYA